MEALLNERLKARFEELSQSTPQEFKVDPVVVAKFAKSNVTYYAIAYDPEGDRLLCYISGGDDTQGMPVWVKVSELEQSLLPGRGARRDLSFTEMRYSNIEIEPRPDYMYQPTELEQMESIRDEQMPPVSEVSQEENAEIER